MFKLEQGLYIELNARAYGKLRRIAAVPVIFARETSEQRNSI